MEKIKIIQASHSSESYSLGEGEKDLKKLVLNDWPARVSKQIKKIYPEIEIECWAPERIYKKDESYEEYGVIFRFFPVTLSLRYALDISIPMLKELKKEIEKSKKEGYKLIIHFHEVHNLHGLLIASLFKNEKVILQHHGGSWPVKHLGESKKKKWIFPFFLLGQLWENLVLKNIKYYYILSKEEMDYLKKRAPDSKIRFQTMGIEDEYFKKMNKKTARKKLKIPFNKKLILYIGKIARIKGMGFLLEAMKNMQSVELKCIGFGPEERIFKDYVKENKLENVEFLGGVFGEKKMLYLRAADALILPSLREGAPVTVMEALACNTPVVVSNVGGVPLMIENGREGIIIKQKSPEEIIKGVREILKWKNKNVRKYADKYRWKKIVDGTIKDYMEI
ncbi:MAG: glycosyltransferase family 4 protein [Nanoarchaeota archaeon]